jgi:hypothetical protein
VGLGSSGGHGVPPVVDEKVAALGADIHNYSTFLFKRQSITERNQVFRGGNLTKKVPQ